RPRRNGPPVPRSAQLLHGTHPLFRGAGHLLRATADRSTERLARSAERIARFGERKAQIPAPKFAPRRLSSGPDLAQATKKRGPLWPPEHDFGRSARPWPRKTA